MSVFGNLRLRQINIRNGTTQVIEMATNTYMYSTRKMTKNRTGIYRNLLRKISNTTKIKSNFYGYFYVQGIPGCNQIYLPLN